MTFFQASLKELINNELSLEEMRNAFSELEIKNVVDFKEKKKTGELKVPSFDNLNALCVEKTGKNFEKFFFGNNEINRRVEQRLLENGERIKKWCEENNVTTIHEYRLAKRPKDFPTYKSTIDNYGEDYFYEVLGLTGYKGKNKNTLTTNTTKSKFQNSKMADTTISFEDFKADWLTEITNGTPSTVELGNRFSKKLVMQWLDFNEDTDDIIFCDGSGDGGIDIAYLQRGDTLEDNANEGDTWYLIQSKYGSAFAGKDTLLIEAQKVIETIDGKTKRLSSIANDLLERLQMFRASASAKDKLVLVFATNGVLTDDEKRVLNDIKTLGRSRLGNMFDTEAVSIETIYQRAVENLSQYKKYILPFIANLVPSGNDLLVGSVKLNNLYQFLKDYKSETGDLDLIYEKNVRKFLGSGKKVNAGIALTIRENPERFGLYNNGITIVVEDFKLLESDKYELTEPYVVNGCQTTRTIWETLYKKLEAGGTGVNPELEEWKNRLKKGIVVVKVVKVGENGDELLTNTTRFTNSQNAVGQKDFIALEGNFRVWAKEMGNTYNIFLEIQRGGWDSQKTIQRTNPSAKIYNDYANAFDLLKNYGAGWLNEPGYAFGKNPPFAPGGSIFKRIIESDTFSIKDIYASYLFQKLAQKIKFGRGAEKPSRGQTKFLFFYVVVELLKECMMHSNIEISNTNVTDAVIRVFKNLDADAATQLSEAALNVIDDYLTMGNEDAIYTEPKFSSTGDLNNFLKWERLGKGADNTPKLSNLIAFTKRDMRRSVSGQQAARDIISAAILE